MDKQRLVQYWQNSKITSRFKDSTVLFIREDGLCIFSNTDNVESSFGALMGGSWQAAMTLIKTIDQGSEENDFRFSFDTANKGVHILKLKYNSMPIYVGLIFNNVTNPALLKNNFRVLLKDIEQSLDGVVEIQSKDEFLFNDISDDEIDNLFSFVGN